jgi:hypothetical protein
MVGFCRVVSAKRSSRNLRKSFIFLPLAQGSIHGTKIQLYVSTGAGIFRTGAGQRWYSLAEMI